MIPFRGEPCKVQILTRFARWIFYSHPLTDMRFAFSDVPGNKKSPSRLNLDEDLNLADSEGFEPPVPYGTIVFKTTAFDHSANYPSRSPKRFSVERVQK